MKEYIKIAEIPKEEKIVATTSYGDFYYWDFKFPFRHYKEPRYVIATERNIYELKINQRQE